MAQSVRLWVAGEMDLNSAFLDVIPTQYPWSHVRSFSHTIFLRYRLPRAKGKHSKHLSAKYMQLTNALPLELGLSFLCMHGSKHRFAAVQHVKCEYI